MLLVVGGLPTLAQPIAGFSVSQVAGCSPLTVVFTNTSTGFTNPVSFAWNLGKGGVPVVTPNFTDNEAATYTAPGVYTVTLTVLDGAGSNTYSSTITVYNNPTVAFSAAPSGGCTPLPVLFSSTSTAGSGTISAYTWDFGDGNTATALGADTTHTYIQALSPPVTLTVTNSYGCSASLRQTGLVSIQPTPQAGFTVDSTVFCVSTNPIAFTNTSAGPGGLTYLWRFGDGANSAAAAPTHTYPGKGLYTVSLIATSPAGCADTTTRVNYVDVANFSPSFRLSTPVCAGTVLSLSDISNPASSSDVWDFGDGTTATGLNVTHAFGVAGTYPVTLTGTFGACLSTAVHDVTVNPLPYQTGFITTPASVCGTAPEQVSFKDTTQAAAQWQWYSGDPSGPSPFSTQSSAVYTYTRNGIYHPSLTLTSAAGCTYTVPGVVVVGPDSAVINIQASAYQSCTPVTVQCSATATTSITSYLWDFGDGTSSASPTPTHTYSNPGVYHIALTFVNSNGCTARSTWNDSIGIYQKPTADFTVSNPTLCGNNLETIRGTTTNADSYYWFVGDGFSAETSGPEVAFKYQHAGTYSVTFIAANPGCADTVVKNDIITVSDNFGAITSATNTCDGSRGLMTFTDSVSAGSTNWSWNFGDGTTVSGATPPTTMTHVYTQSGLYYNIFIVNGPQCPDTTYYQVAVMLKQNPILTTTAGSVCAGAPLPVTVTGLAYNVNAAYNGTTTIGYSLAAWQYGDGTTLPMPYTVFDTTYAGYLTGLASGKDSIRYITQSESFGCYDTSNWVPVKITGPIAGFKVNTAAGCYRFPVTLTDTSTGTGGVPLVRWEWSFGDGAGDTLGTGGSVTHTYPAPYKTYQPALTVIDADGCMAGSGSGEPAVVLNGPQASFSWTPPNITPGTTAVFTNTTPGAFSGVQWTFASDGSVSTDPISVSHTYPDITTDTVTLVVYDNTPGYCPSDTARRLVPVSYVSASFTTTARYLEQGNCPPLQVSCTSTTSNVTAYVWNFGDGSPLVTAPNPVHTYSTAGKYYITLNATGMGVTVTALDSVTVGGPYGQLEVAQTNGCSPAGAVLTAANLSDVVSFSLDLGDGTVVTAQSPDTVIAHVYTTAGVYSPILTATDAVGCTVAYYPPNPIVADSLKTAFTPDIQRLCDSGLVRYDATVYSLSQSRLGDSVRYHWTFGTGNPGDTSDLPDPAFYYTAPGTYTVQFSALSVPGCLSTVTDSIQVVQGMRAAIGGPDSGCVGTAIALTALAAGPVGGGAGIVPAYTWLFPGGRTDAAATPSSILLPQGADTVLLITTANGCSDTAVSAIRVYAPPIPLVTPADTTICKGDSLALSASGGIAYQWNDTTGLSSYTAVPVATATYIVLVTDAHGCTARDSARVGVISPFTLRFPPDTSVCLGDSLVLPVSGAAAYRWITTGPISDTTSANPVLSPVVNTPYEVIGYAPLYCFADTATVLVSVVAKPTVSVPPVAPVSGGSVLLQATGSPDVVSWSWSPATWLSCTDCASTYSTPQGNIVYTVTGRTVGGCAAEDTVVVRVACMASNVRVPGAFTPNNDGINDFFYPMGQGVSLIRSFRVYGRWGNLVFEQHDVPFGGSGSGWDGKAGGMDQPTGVYVYDILLQCITGEIFELKGTVLLER